MSDAADWLPPLILLAEHDGKWQRYIDSVYDAFRKDFIDSVPMFEGKAVLCRKDPIYDGKKAGFWHCVSEGKTENDRTPDLRRCERIGWVRAILEHATEPGIDIWENERQGERRKLIWFREEFLIVLALRPGKRGGSTYYQFLTAYRTMEEHRKWRLRKERDAYRATTAKKLTPPPS